MVELCPEEWQGLAGRSRAASIFASFSELGEEGVFHLKLNTEKRKALFGDAFNALHLSTMLSRIVFLSASRKLDLLTSKFLISDFSDLILIPVEVANVLITDLVSKEHDAILQDFAHVGGLNETVTRAVMTRYNVYVERVIDIVCNLVPSMSRSAVKKTAGSIAIDYTPKVRSKAELKSQAFAGPGGSMADSKLNASSSSSNRLPPPLKKCAAPADAPPLTGDGRAAPSAPPTHNRPALHSAGRGASVGAAAMPSGDEGVHQLDASSPSKSEGVRRKSGLDLPGSQRKPPAPEGDERLKSVKTGDNAIPLSEWNGGMQQQISAYGVAAQASRRVSTNDSDSTPSSAATDAQVDKYRAMVSQRVTELNAAATKRELELLRTIETATQANAALQKEVVRLTEQAAKFRAESEMKDAHIQLLKVCAPPPPPWHPLAPIGQCTPVLAVLGDEGVRVRASAHAIRCVV